MSATSIGTPWMPEPDAKILAESGDWNEDNGMRVVLMEHFLVVQVAIHDHSCELHLPVIDILEAITAQTKHIGH